MKFILFFLTCVLLFADAQAQSPFKPLPKFKEAVSPLVPGNKLSYAKAAGGGVIATDSILNNWRFGVAVSPAGYTFGGVYQAAAGLEYGLQHQDYNYASQTYTVLWSANLVWIPIQANVTRPMSIKDIATFGALFGFKNNLVQIGPFINPNAPGAFKDKAGFWAVIGINLN